MTRIPCYFVDFVCLQSEPVLKDKCSHLILLPINLISETISESPGCKSIAELSLKIVFWTHKFAFGLIDMGNNESQDP